MGSLVSGAGMEGSGGEGTRDGPNVSCKREVRNAYCRSKGRISISWRGW